MNSDKNAAAQNGGFILLPFPDAPVSVFDKEYLDKTFNELAACGVHETGVYDPLKHLTAVRCFEAKEVPGTVFCVFNNRKAMNEVLIRITAFIELSEGTYISKEEFFSDKPYKNSVIKKETVEYFRGNTPEYPGVSGHDVPGREINKFLNLNKRDLTKPAEYKNEKLYSEMEDKFLDFLQNTVRAKFGDNYTIISSSTNKNYIPTMSHEFLHAQYFALPEFRRAVNDYADMQTAKKDFELFVAFCKSSVYPKMGPADLRWRDGAADPAVEGSLFLRNNEFLAFMLSKGMYEDGLVRFPTLVAVMRKHLLPAGEHDPEGEAFFNEIYALWAANNFGRDGSGRDIAKASFEIMKKYNLQTPVDVEKSGFFNYLKQRGVPPAVIK